MTASKAMASFASDWFMMDRRMWNGSNRHGSLARPLQVSVVFTRVIADHRHRDMGLDLKDWGQVHHGNPCWMEMAVNMVIGGILLAVSAHISPAFLGGTEGSHSRWSYTSSARDRPQHRRLLPHQRPPQHPRQRRPRHPCQRQPRAHHLQGCACTCGLVVAARMLTARQHGRTPLSRRPSRGIRWS